MKKIYILFIAILTINAANAQWQQCKGPYGGWIEALTVSGTSIFAKVTNGKVFQSNNNGINWIAKSGKVSGTYNNSLAIKGDTLFTGSENGVFRCTINDTNWYAVNNGLANIIISNLTINGNSIYAGTYGNGLYLSNDNGTNWISLNNGLPSNSNISSIQIIGNNIFVGTYNNGIFLSTNNGINWNQINNGLTDTAVTSIVISGNKIYAGTSNTGLFVSNDYGASWANVNIGMGYNPVKAIAANGTYIAVGTNMGVFLSTDNGLSWNLSNNGLTSVNSIYSLAIIGDSILAGTYIGIYLFSNNSNRWIPRNIGIINTGIDELSTNGANIFAISGGTIFTSSDYGDTWNQFIFSNFSVLALFVDSNRIYACGGTPYIGGIYLSTDNCNTWTAINNGLPVSSAIRSVAARDSFILAETDEGLYLSYNYGNNWTHSNSYLSYFINGNTIFLSENSGIYFPIDNGSFLINTNNLVFPSISALAINGNTIFAGTYQDISISTNNGSTWTEVVPFGSMSCYIFEINGNNIFAGTSNGVYLSTNNGYNWTTANSGLSLSYSDITSLTMMGNNIFAGTYTDGVWRHSLTEQDTITTITNQDIWGSTSGNGVYNFADSCIVKAMPDSGYSFIYWTEDSNIVSYDSIYSFVVTNNRNLVANFVPSTTQFTITDSVYLNEGGTITNGGTFTVNQYCTVKATPDTGYYFLGWGENNYYVSFDTVYTFQVVTNRNLVAYFDFMNYLINTSVSPANSGTIVGDGFLFNYDSICTLTATPNTGYVFVRWTENGNIVSLDSIYTFTVTGDRYLIASFYSIPGIVNNSLNNTINLYPNPTKDNLTIETNLNTEQRIEIINLMGQTVYTSIINKKATINTSAFPSGVYILKLYTDKETVVRKFVKE